MLGPPRPLRRRPWLTPAVPRALVLGAGVQGGLPLPQLHLFVGAAVGAAESEPAVAALRIHSRRRSGAATFPGRKGRRPRAPLLPLSLAFAAAVAPRAGPGTPLSACGQPWGLREQGRGRACPASSGRAGSPAGSCAPSPAVPAAAWGGSGARVRSAVVGPLETCVSWSRCTVVAASQKRAVCRMR